MATSIYEDVTAKIVAQLEMGVAPWRRPWAGGSTQMPRNAVSNRPYSGVNVWLLWLASEANGWSSGRWATYRAWNRLGGHVSRGQKGTKVTYWNVSDKKTADPDTDHKQPEKRFFLRTYTVFALEQCNGESLEQFSTPPSTKQFVDFEPAEKAIAATGAEIQHGGERAFYAPTSDFIKLPAKASFTTEADYYSTALHELTHWTGHQARLNRLDKLARFGDDTYAVEELVAEMGAAYLTAAVEVPNTSAAANSASYLADWLRVLRADSRAIFTAATAAQKAADYVLAFSRKSHEMEEVEERELQEA
jgi:antirestriction protein ArdC